MDKKLLQTRNEIYKRCPGIFWGVSIFAIIVAVALAALNALIPGLYFVTFGILFFPLLFATFITLLSIKYGGTVSVKSTFSIAKSYFSRGNFGCFRILRCLLHAFLVYLVSSFLFSLILEPIFTNIYGTVFVEELDNFANSIYSSTSILELFENESSLTLFYSCIFSFSFSSALITFIYGIWYNSFNVYLCANIPNAAAAYCTAIFSRFLGTCGKSYRKDFWSLNWPNFVLFVFGVVAGYALTILLDIDFSYGMVISSMLGLICLIPFAPLYFANMEALFAKYSEKVKSVSADMTQGFLKNLRDNVNLSDEDKAKIDELLSKGQNPPKDDENKEE